MGPVATTERGGVFSFWGEAPLYFASLEDEIRTGETWKSISVTTWLKGSGRKIHGLLGNWVSQL